MSSKYDPSRTSTYNYLINYENSSEITDQQLAAYLRFYNIGLNLIDDGGLTIAPEKKMEAEKLLYKYVAITPGAV